MLKHPFEIGNRYENRQGKYEVIGINGTQMAIRYDDGEVLETPIPLQKRIMENMALDKEVEKQQKRQRKQIRRKRSSHYGRNFSGLAEDDFRESVVGTSWRARGGLGGLLAKELSHASGRPFISRAVPRRPQVYVVESQAYNPDLPWQKAKFHFTLSDQAAHYGLYVEKGRDEVGTAWDWQRLVRALNEDNGLRGMLTRTMDQHDLQWHVEVKDADDEPELEAKIQVEADNLVMRNGADSPQPIDWSGFVEMLNNIEPDHDCDLQLTQSVDKQAAIALDTQIATEVAAVWNRLLPLYHTCIRNGAIV